jgi:hypothetical protein
VYLASNYIFLPSWHIALTFVAMFDYFYHGFSPNVGVKDGLGLFEDT